MGLNVCTVTRAFVRISSIYIYPPIPHICVKRIACGPLTTHQISTQSVQPFPRYGNEVRTCTCNTPLAFVKCQTNGSLTPNQISAQSIQPFPRHGKVGYICTCARAGVSTTHDLCNMHRGLVSKHTPNGHYRPIHS